MQKRHELSTTHERLRLDRCQHILNLLKDGTVSNLVFTDEKKFDVQQFQNHQNYRVWSRDGSVEGRRVSRRQNPRYVMVWAAKIWDISTSFLYPQEWNYTARIIFWKLNCFPGHLSTLMVYLGLFNKTPLRHMAAKWLKAGFRLTFQRSLAKMNGPQLARIWTHLTCLCGQFWRVRFTELHDSLDNMK